jgi:hypothetical protein
LEENIIEEKIVGRIQRGRRTRDNKYMGQIKKKEKYWKKYQEVGQLALDRARWRAAVNQSDDILNDDDGDFPHPSLGVLRHGLTVLGK